MNDRRESAPLDRRQFLGDGLGASLGAGLSAGLAASAAGCAVSGATLQAPTRHPHQAGASPWPICLDTATIRPASLSDKVRIAATAGFDAIEPWEGELHGYEQSGGNLAELGQQIRDHGLFVPSVIGLWNAIPATREEWERALPDHRRRMRQAAAIGAQHIQVVPQPARAWREFDPRWAADRYRELLEIGLGDYGINPAIVFVNFLEGCRRLGQAAAIAIDADHPNAKVIPDVFHMYLARNGFHGLKHLRGNFIAIFQINDAPASPSLEQLEQMQVGDADAMRVFPGDGILPLGDILRDLHAIGYTGCVSLELYNREYHARDLLAVAREGRAKTVGLITDALRAVTERGS